jgi:glycosyltransferase involved in cell wall biosynthesis
MRKSGNISLTVIIPTLNEAENLPALLEDLKQQSNITLEIIVGDGGLTGTTRLVAESYGAAFVSSGRERGVQMIRTHLDFHCQRNQLLEQVA